MPPLAGVRVKERRTVHLTCGAVPICRKSQRCPARLRAQFLLTHIMAPAAARLSHATAHHQHVDDAAIRHVHVIPVVQCRADNDHAFAIGLVCIEPKLTCDLDDHLWFHTRVLLLPCRCIRFIGLHVIAGDIFTSQTTIQTVVGNQQIKHRCDQSIAAIRQSDAFGRHIPNLHILRIGATKILESNSDHVISAIDQTQLGFNLLAIVLLRLEVPFTLLSPTKTNGAFRRHHIACVLIDDQGFPVGVVVLPCVAR